MPTSQKIRAQRNSVGLSQAELALRLRKFDPTVFGSFDLSVISRIESEQRAVKTTELKGIATVLGCRVADLIDEVGE